MLQRQLVGKSPEAGFTFFFVNRGVSVRIDLAMLINEMLRWSHPICRGFCRW